MSMLVQIQQIILSNKANKQQSEAKAKRSCLPRRDSTPLPLSLSIPNSVPFMRKGANFAMSRLGSILVYGLKSMHHKPQQKKKSNPITARSIFGDLICDTYQYYTQPKMSEEERKEFHEWMQAPIPEPPKKLTTAQRIASLEKRLAKYESVGSKRKAK
jgi:hypothetical protein